MDQNQTAPSGAVCSGFIVFASLIKSSLKSIGIYAADVKSRHFQLSAVAQLVECWTEDRRFAKFETHPLRSLRNTLHPLLSTISM